MVRYVTHVRLWVDDYTYDKFNMLLSNTKGLLSRHQLCTAILEEWNKAGGPKKIGNVNLDNYITGTHFIPISANESAWYNFAAICTKNDIHIYPGFRMAVLYFLELVDMEMLMMLANDS